MENSKPDHPKGAPARQRKKNALGRGLGALIPDMDPDGEREPDFFQCSVDRIGPNPFQPRIRFGEDELEELADSIRTQGVLQPLLVRKAGHGYELIAGERRLRAARKAGVPRVPVIVREIGDAEMLEISIIENLQRESLDPVEEADAYHQLMTRFDMTQEQVAARVGKSRSAVANILRLRQLPAAVKADIARKAVSMGHARALLGADAPAILNQAWRAVVSRGLSVRDTERLVRRLNRERTQPVRPAPDSDRIYFDGLAEDLSRRFGTKVQIKRRGQRGRVEVDFYSDSDLDRVITLLKGS